MNQFLKENNSFKFTEVIALFVGTPLVLLISIPVFYKIIYLLIGIIYIILVSIFIEKFQITNIDKNFKKTTIKQI